MPDLKIIFAANLPLNLFGATIANADTEIIESLFLFDMHLDHILAKFEPNRMVKNVQKFELLDKNPSYLNHF